MFFLRAHAQGVKQSVPSVRLSVCLSVCLVWVPAPSHEEEGSGTLRINDLFFTPHGYRGATIECELVIATRFTCCDMELRNVCIP